MADSPENKGSQDRIRININQEHEVRYWTEKFGVSSDQLRQAVEKVGVMVEDVERELQQNKR